MFIGTKVFVQRNNEMKNGQLGAGTALHSDEIIR